MGQYYVPGPGVTSHMMGDLVDVLTRLQKELAAAGTAPVYLPDIPEDGPAAWAIRLLKVRSKRAEIFPVNLRGEPGYDMLLGLYVADCEQRAVTVGEACGMTSVPPSTAQRAMADLERRRLIKRRPGEEDRRRTVVALTEAGEALVERFLTALRQI